MIPQPIYELLPYLYFLAGVLSLVGVEHPIGKVAGLLLIAAAVIIHQYRAHNRKKSKKRLI